MPLASNAFLIREGPTADHELLSGFLSHLHPELDREVADCSTPCIFNVLMI
jgi:hypothetical protein